MRRHCGITVDPWCRLIVPFPYAAFASNPLNQLIEAPYQELLVFLSWNTRNEQQQFGTIWCFLWNTAMSLLPRQRPKSKTALYITSWWIVGQRSAGSDFLLNKEVKPWPKTEDGATWTSVERVALWPFLLRTVCSPLGCLLSFIYLLSIFFVLLRTEHQFGPLTFLWNLTTVSDWFFLNSCLRPS